MNYYNFDTAHDTAYLLISIFKKLKENIFSVKHPVVRCKIRKIERNVNFNSNFENIVLLFVLVLYFGLNKSHQQASLKICKQKTGTRLLNIIMYISILYVSDSIHSYSQNCNILTFDCKLKVTLKYIL